ncbi:hypothetical protein [Sediminibacterium sp.]|uniref:beta strand repeat-containing protein n=1 Tax=Sediminibacterium sp. TaxID=1917865 RepID=UPI0025E57D48|nr:hypothetical protein [Sediminibacterium sp.]
MSMFGVMVRSEAQQLNYQAIARNANGVALTFRDVGIRLSIRDGSQTGSIVYSETRNVRTNQFGLFTVVIGSPGASNVLGSMASINWISGNKYLQVEIDPEGGNNYFQAGTSQLQAVPYALFANAAYPVGPAGGDLLGSTYPNPIIAPLAVTTGKLANQAVTTPKIADLNVTTAKLADQSITNPKIQDNTIANIKLANSKVTLNGLILNLGDTQDFAVGTNGTDVNIISAGKTHTFNFPDASIANRGLITPNAQTIGGNKTFNNDITAARIIRAGGIAAQFLKADGSVDNNIYLTANQPIIVTATGDATGVSTSSGTAPVLPLTLATVNSAVGTFGNNITVPSITANNKGLITNITSNPIPTATATTSGLLTVGDWNTFNNKQNAIPLGTTTQYFRGDLSLGNFTNDVRNQLSAGTNITYTNGNIGLTNNSVTINSLPLALGGSQSFATGSTGNDFNISSAGTVHSFNIPTASATNRGLLSSNDFSNFNTAYTSRITGLTTTGSSGPATLSGNVLNIPNYTLAGLGGISSSTTLNGLSLSSNQTFSSGIIGTDFNIISSGTNHTFNFPTASASARGLLSSSDWSTFNNKQVAISGIGYGKWNGSAISFNNQIPLGSDVSGTLLAANFGQLTGDVTNTPGSYTTTITNNAITTTKIADGAVSNAKLINKSITINGLPVELGSSQTLLAGSGGTDFNISSIGSTHTFNLPSSSASNRGLLTSTDWINFNNKQAAISGTGYSKWSGSTPSFNTTIPLGTDVSGTLLASNFGQLTGDVTNAPGSYATTIANDAITSAKIADGAVSNAKLTSNGSFTLGSTSISLGSTTTTVAGLTLNSPTINTPAIYYTNTPTGLTAGANSQGSLNLTNDINVITTAAASSAVTLPVAQSGRQVTIINRGANPINVYPASSAQINTLGTNAAFSSVPANSYAEFYATSASQWYSANSIATSTSSWNIVGNSGLNVSNNFLGTTDAVALRFRVNNTFSGQIHPDANVGNTSFGFETNSTTNNSSYITAFGSQALKANTNSGLRNSAFGALALTSNNSGLDNTGIGQGALSANLSGDNNTGIGQGALTFNSTGTSNTAVGQAALNSNTTTSNNTAVGKSALFANGGSNNTGIGHFALTANTTGNANTAVGQNSLSANTTTSNNTAVGWEALRSTTNNGNVGIGFRADVTTSAQEAVAVGINATVTGNNSVAIGRNSSASNINGIVIGNTASANSLNSISIGSPATTTNVYTIAIGDNTTSSGENGIAIGKNATASQQNSVAIGSDATNNTINSVLIGGTSNVLVNATGALTATGSITAGGRINGTGAKFNYVETSAATFSVTINHYYIKVTASSTITLPSASGLEGQRFVIVNRHSAGITISSTSAFDGYSFAGTLGTGKTLIVFSDGTNWILETNPFV